MIIGLFGKAGSGKDTAADFLVKEHNFTKVSLADPMKRFCAEVFNFSEEQLWGPSGKRNEEDRRYPRNEETSFLTPRYALQQLGTEWGRDCHQDVWINYALRITERLLAREVYFQDIREGFPELGVVPVPGHFEYVAKTGIGNVLMPGARRGVVIPDIRFLNEILAIKRAGGKVVKIVRPGSGLSGAAGVHLSETEQDIIPDNVFDLILYNDKSLDALAEGVKAVLTI